MVFAALTRGNRDLYPPNGKGVSGANHQSCYFHFHATFKAKRAAPARSIIKRCSSEGQSTALVKVYIYKISSHDAKSSLQQ